MKNWFKRRRKPEPPTLHTETIGELHVSSGAILLADPRCIFDPIRIEGVPFGWYPVQAQMIHYPEGGVRIARIRLVFRPGLPDARQTVGTIGVDSAIVVAGDARACEQHWKEVGPERIGYIPLPGHDKVAKLIEKRFGLKPRQVNADGPVLEFEEPISEELETQIIEYLKAFPEYAEFPFFYFAVKTMNTCDRIFEALEDRLWNEVVLDESSGASLLAFKSGLGDGRYPVDQLSCSGELVGVEIRAIASRSFAGIKGYVSGASKMGHFPTLRFPNRLQHNDFEMRLPWRGD